MELVPGFVQLLPPLASTMTAPTFDSLITVLTGWVFASRRTVTRMILAAGFFQADPHPGNLFVTRAGEIVLLDLLLVIGHHLRVGLPLLIFRRIVSLVSLHQVRSSLSQAMITSTAFRA